MVDNSFCNYKEVRLIGRLLKRYKWVDNNNGIEVGVITPYQAQRKTLIRELGEKMEYNSYNNKDNKNKIN